MTSQIGWLLLVKMTCIRGENYAQQSLLSHRILRSHHKVIALYADNSPAWVIIDLACRLAAVTLLPLPSFFSDQQLRHAIKQAGASSVIHQANDRMDKLLNLTDHKSTSLISLSLKLSDIELKDNASLPTNTNKITFTSGSTGQPKGVCLSNEQQTSVAQSLLKATGLHTIKHLSVLPFSTLLENIGGIYAPLLSGGSIVALPQAALGFNGSSGFELSTLLEAITKYEPHSMILLPELLMALTGAIQQGWQPPESLKFIAVGGSKVSPLLLQQAQKLGLAVYEGYGLSECASVVSLNTPSNSKNGSIGKVLDHVDVTIEEGEIVVSGNAFLGYINEPASWSRPKVHTGDLGFIDDQGYLHIQGRKKNLLISSFGRNINPEWVESELLANGLLHQCVIFGDAKPHCMALLYPRNQETNDDSIRSWLHQVNQTLPDYAQIHNWIRLVEPLSVEQGFITSNGRPVREKIYQYYETTIEQLYQDQNNELF